MSHIVPKTRFQDRLGDVLRRSLGRPQDVISRRPHDVGLGCPQGVSLGRPRDGQIGTLVDIEGGRPGDQYLRAGTCFSNEAEK